MTAPFIILIQTDEMIKGNHKTAHSRNGPIPEMDQEKLGQKAKFQNQSQLADEGIVEKPVRGQVPEPVDDKNLHKAGDIQHPLIVGEKPKEHLIRHQAELKRIMIDVFSLLK